MAKSTSPSKSKAVKASKTVAKASKPPKKADKAKKVKIFRYVCEQHVMGVAKVSVMDIALAVGNTNVRSEGFSLPMKELADDDKLISKGLTGVSLTDKGIEAIPDDLEVSNDPSKIHDRYIAFIENKVKMGKDKVRTLWDLLMDRQAHLINDLSTELGYTNPRSFANTKIISAMKETGLVESAGKGTIRFTDKVPRA
jgi:hypothetical protein